jgi:5-formyltetrahydrofolate cyclo-ligase
MTELRVLLMLHDTLVALALQEQILDAGDVPVGDHDWKVDAIVSPEGVTMRNA